ncbi:hypothetical protein L6164_009402 [Bauhinia variegata]|uniref:Uncharacterized protein n=1 Tax=Bauhinia variegata TaxID=167791 RepID=A0ACB9PL86_BAUVA|nr:hypothetical protein L6164_009402 [Bauhinia variegata]
MKLNGAQHSEPAKSRKNISASCSQAWWHGIRQEAFSRDMIGEDKTISFVPKSVDGSFGTQSSKLQAKAELDEEKGTKGKGTFPSFFGS